MSILKKLITRAPALGHRDFVLLWSGQTLSNVGSQIQQVALAWQLYLLTHSPVSLGLIGIFRVVPVVGLSLVAGVVADAFDRRRLMLATQVMFALSSATLALLTFTGHITPAAIYAMTFIGGCADGFDAPARQSLFPRLVPDRHLENALSLNITTYQLASVAGPGLGGLLLGWGGISLCYAVDAASFLFVIAALLAMKHRHIPASGSSVSIKAALEGLRFVRGQPIMLGMMLLDFAATFLAGAMQLMPIFADEVLHVGARGLGLLFAAPAAGASVAALVMSAIPPVKNRGRVFIIGVAFCGLGVTVFGFSKSFPLSLLMMAVFGAADTVSMVVRQTTRQLLTPDALRGRMTALNMIFVKGGPQLGEVEAGLAAKLLGAPLSVALGGIGCFLVAVLTWMFWKSVREHRADDPVYAAAAAEQQRARPAA